MQNVHSNTRARVNDMNHISTVSLNEHYNMIYVVHKLIPYLKPLIWDVRDRRNSMQMIGRAFIFAELLVFIKINNIVVDGAVALKFW